MIDDEANVLYDRLIEQYKVKRNITKELKEIMEEKGYETLEDFRGKLHYID